MISSHTTIFVMNNLLVNYYLIKSEISREPCRFMWGLAYRLLKNSLCVSSCYVSICGLIVGLLLLAHILSPISNTLL